MRRLFLALGAGLVAGAIVTAASAADNIFIIKGIHVDATAASSSKAQIVAIGQGTPKAWAQLYRKLTRQADWGKQPKLDDATLSRLLRGYEVANEKRSTTRYVADITYVFNPDAVQAVLKGANIAFAESTAKTVMIIPLSPGYNLNSAWARAWKDPQLANSVVPITLPTSDVNLSGVTLGGVKWADIQQAALRVRATEAVIVQEAVNGNQINVQMRRVGPGPQYGTNISVPVAPGQPPNEALVSAAVAANQVIADNWKNHAAVNYNVQNNLVADVRISSLDDWAGLQGRLAGISTIAAVNIVAMNTSQARLEIGYVGTLDQLKDALRQQGLALSGQQDGIWSLAQGAALETDGAVQ